jgi:hypothetical protein
VVASDAANAERNATIHARKSHSAATSCLSLSSARLAEHSTPLQRGMLVATQVPRKLAVGRCVTICQAFVGRRISGATSVIPRRRADWTHLVRPRESSEWRDSESNRGHHDFQSCALPTELSRRARCSPEQRRRPNLTGSKLAAEPEGDAARDQHLLSHPGADATGGYSARTGSGMGSQANQSVLVYRHEAQLVDVAGSFLSEALDGGGAAIALATGPHLRALERWIGACGSDVDAAAADGRYHRLAVENVVELLDDDARADAFEERLLELLNETPADIETVHLFGEMSPQLSERRERAGDLDLAAVGSTLSATRPVTLLAAYHEEVRSVDEQRAREDCDAAIIAPPAFPARAEGASNGVVSSAVLPPAPPACRAARRLVRTACAEEAGPETIDAAELVVSELAGNAVRHARSTFTAEVSFPNGSVRLAVTDAQPLPSGWGGFPIAREHGLGLIATLADDWAVEPLAGGKVVWAELTRNEEIR